MKMERVQLLAALNTVKPALATKDLIEELCHVWFDGKVMTAYNDADLGIQVPFEGEFKGGIRGTLLLGLLEASRAKDIEIEVLQGGEVMLKAARVRAKLAVLDIERGQQIWQFPKAKDKASLFRITPAFITALKAVMVSVGDDTSMPEKMGVTMQVVQNDIMLMATDSQTIAYAPVPWQPGTIGPERAILPTAFCEQLLRICGDEAGWLDLRKDAIIAFNKSGVKVYARLVDMKKPVDLMKRLADHSKFAKEAKFEVPSRLALALQRAMVIVDETIGEAVELAAMTGKLKLDAKHAGRGELKDSVNIPAEVPYIAVNVVPHLIHRALPLVDHMALTPEVIYMSGPNNFCYLAATKGA